MLDYPRPEGLYLPQCERDNCGFGFLCHMKGEASNAIVLRGLDMLENMEHRGACGCEPNTGDGAGIMVATPDKFFRRKAGELGFKLPQPGQYAVSMMFLPLDMVQRRNIEKLFTDICRQYDMSVIGWRDVPTNNVHIGPSAKAAEPRIRQAFVAANDRFYNKKDFNRRLYLVRQQVENKVEFGSEWPETTKKAFYICLLSSNRMVYKGMLTANQLRAYYPDLNDPEFVSPFAVVHSRFSTNTFPSWRLAQPFRYVAHNGEINTIRGNKNWMASRYGTLQSDKFGDELDKLFPIVSETVSDSATLDNALQFLSVNGGRSLAQCVLMMVPEAWQNHQHMDADLKAFYEYHAMQMEPWDGPAGIAFCNGEQIGAVLDRNGLRPARYYITHDDVLIMGSEAGAISVEPENVRRKWRLQPGRMLLCDFTEEKRIIDDEEVKHQLVEKRPWRNWVDEHMLELDSLGEAQREPVEERSLLHQQHAFGYTNEDLRMLMYPMAATGAEAVGSMGADTPLACLSDKPQLLFNYFKQLFAQVTNPPLDAIREELVTSLFTWIGRERNLLDETPKHARLVKLPTPILRDEELAKLAALDQPGFKATTISMLYDFHEKSLEQAVDDLCRQAADAVEDGTTILILSDRGVGPQHAAIPSMLATAAVHHHLIRCGTRTQAGLIIETGEAREGHHFCCLLGYGAGAINPYLALATIRDLHAENLLPAEMSVNRAEKNYVKAAGKAILKVASKMGISTVQSYRGAQIFEAIGIGPDVISKYFTGTASRIGGVDLATIADESLARHRRAFPPIEVEKAEVLDAGGFYQWRRDGEYHAWNPSSVSTLQKAVRLESQKAFGKFSKIINDESKRRATLRGLMEFTPANGLIDIDEVEPAKEIVKRFVTGAMSLGSISTEAHETLAKAMNHLGGKSNSGEGGEDPDRFNRLDAKPLKLGTDNPRRSAIKQVASGRFGVT
ncbi:MAG: glutamate synthase central domain-containing protein, partial [Planctomycetota bacterium]